MISAHIKNNMKTTKNTITMNNKSLRIPTLEMSPIASPIAKALAKFMFNGDDVFKRVGKISGREKVRLKLFELIKKNVNLLVLDEPTNHIDINTKEVLENALKEYQGTILFISHDRYFINEIAKKILYIENHKINDYIGNYDDYVETKARILKKK